MQRNPAMDGLRGVAALLVLACHVAPEFLPGGFMGVDIFFVLSGFLITSLLKREMDLTGGIDFWWFYAKRAIRLYPPLLSVLVAYVILGPCIWPESPHLTNALLAGLYLTDYSYPIWGQPLELAHTWSLSIEEQYYLIWPWLLLLVIWKRQSHVSLLLALYVVATVWRVIKGQWFGWNQVVYPLDSHVSGLILGAIIAHLPVKLGDEAAQILGTTCMFTLSALALTVGEGSAAIGVPFTLVELATAGLIVSVASERTVVATLLSAKPIVFTGTISYALYLWHVPIWLAWGRDEPLWPKALVVVASSYALAALSWFLIERQTMRWRHRIATTA